ncbi:hypothetical protein TIFTF001_030798 [Ficus carica]|uniref:BSD domain-containing protein n=1 Tax=Ficus carica TaxID=3494 RepID=A0AA88DU04_FICCA|nr:hypothetical protein TIFTF001_030798 [Ficus carica]
MDFWHKARSFAEEATKRSQELAKDAARRSQELAAAGAPKLSDIVSEASKRADQFRSEALKRTEDLKLFASAIAARAPPETPPLDDDLQAFGVTEELREFVQGITPTTFSDFPPEDDTQLYDFDTVSNVRQDLSEWQEKHASLVLSTVKEISKLRYELCPRVMKERKFWRIYFILVNNHVAPYEKKYREAVESKSAEQIKDERVQEGPTKVETTSKVEVKEANPQSTTSTSSSTEQDLDVFLLGEAGDSDDDDGPVDHNGGDFDDDFDKMLEGLDDDKDDL